MQFISLRSAGCHMSSQEKSLIIIIIIIIWWWIWIINYISATMACEQLNRLIWFIVFFFMFRYYLKVLNIYLPVPLIYYDFFIIIIIIIIRTNERKCCGCNSSIYRTHEVKCIHRIAWHAYFKILITRFNIKVILICSIIINTANITWSHAYNIIVFNT